jgi:hypothetical protein
MNGTHFSFGQISAGRYASPAGVRRVRRKPGQSQAPRERRDSAAAWNGANGSASSIGARRRLLNLLLLPRADPRTQPAPTRKPILCSYVPCSWVTDMWRCPHLSAIQLHGTYCRGFRCRGSGHCARHHHLPHFPFLSPRPSLPSPFAARGCGGSKSLSIPRARIHPTSTTHAAFPSALRPGSFPSLFFSFLSLFSPRMHGSD